MKKTFISSTIVSVFLFLGCTNSNNTLQKEKGSQYSIIWKYTIKPEAKTTFEQEYGSSGIWSRLFNESKKYVGSTLHKSDNDEYVYILIDTWTDKQSYEDFKKKNAERYNQLSKKFESLYNSEEKIGAFNVMK